MILDIVIAVLVLVGAGLVLGSAVAMLRAPDALSRINVFSPATGLGLPLLVFAGYLERATWDGFDLGGTLKLIATVGALLVVSSVATNVLARSAYLSGAPVDRRTSPNDLANDPEAS